MCTPYYTVSRCLDFFIYIILVGLIKISEIFIYIRRKNCLMHFMYQTTSSWCSLIRTCRTTKVRIPASPIISFLPNELGRELYKKQLNEILCECFYSVSGEGLDNSLPASSSISNTSSYSLFFNYYWYEISFCAFNYSSQQYSCTYILYDISSCAKQHVFELWADCVVSSVLPRLVV